jgi:endonuclease/exonuclease/phosphatase family metal-dependent hydrolase
MSTISALVFLFALTACGANEARVPRTLEPGTPESSPTPRPSSQTPQPAPSELRVAYISLGSPITLDENDTEAADTYADRLQLVIEELRAFDPDIVALSEVTWSQSTGNAAWTTLATGLGLEGKFARANPYYPGQTPEDSDTLRDLIGFEEGEAVLSRYPILQSRRHALNPRTSEHEGRIALHAVVRIPGIGDVNVLVSRLAGDEPTLQAQAADLERLIEDEGADLPTLVFADMGIAPDSPSIALFQSSGYADVVAGIGGGFNLATCCRDRLLIPATTIPGTGTPLLPPGTEDDGNGDDEASEEPVEDETPDPGDDAEAPPVGGAMVRHSYILSNTWRATSVALFGTQAHARSDGSQLYPSYQNGLFAVIPLAQSSGSSSR